MSMSMEECAAGECYCCGEMTVDPMTDICWECGYGEEGFCDSCGDYYECFPEEIEFTEEEEEIQPSQ